VRRIRLAALLLALAVFVTSSGQAPHAARVVRVGVLAGSESYLVPPVAYALPARLSLLGYTQGKDVIVESEFAQDNADLPERAAAMVASGINVLVADGARVVAATATLATSPPIVGVWAVRPVRPPLSPPRPGLTGLALQRSNRQRLEILQALVPGLARVAVIGRLAEPDDWADVERAARSLGLDPHPLDVRPTDDVDAILRQVQAAGATAILVPDGSPRDAAVRLQAARVRLPIIFPQAYFARPPQEGLMSFGVDAAHANDRVAAMVDGIVRGAKPGDLPVELISKFELVINRRRASDLRLTIPPSILQRATTVID
jgi:putative ABC transport system substrate-binding protein